MDLTILDGAERLQKAETRRRVVALILAMDPADRLAQEASLVEKLEILPGFAEARSVLLYASSFPEEVETRPMLLRALERGKRLILPRVSRLDQKLRLFEVADLDLDLTVRRGIFEPLKRCPEVEPEGVDWVLVPGLGFDDRCHRLGRGGGYYDRLLPMLRAEAPRWALILDRQWVEALPVEPHDQAVDGVADARRTVLRSTAL